MIINYYWRFAVSTFEYYGYVVASKLPINRYLQEI